MTRAGLAHDQVGVVVGGGLLGLEAANALRLLGVSTHVVELARRLMPLQVNEGGGALLRRQVEKLGLMVHCGVSTQAVEAGSDGRVERVRLADGSTLDAGLVVFSAGVRPRDDLARAAGLGVGERGGVAVDSGCRTTDPHIYAVGECACLDGRVYGLVGPRLRDGRGRGGPAASGTATFPGADLSTKLKLLGVDVPSFGDAHAAADDALEVVHNDQVSGAYKKLVAPSGGAGTGIGVGALPDDAQVCSCHAVTKAAVISAIADGGCADVAAVKGCTKAGTGCGSCVPMLKQLLVDCGVEQSRALCEHFDYSRAELFEIVRSTGIRTFSRLIERHGR
jgi:nitrite reductase (NADH) large subunit